MKIVCIKCGEDVPVSQALIHDGLMSYWCKCGASVFDTVENVTNNR